MPQGLPFSGHTREAKYPSCSEAPKTGCNTRSAASPALKIVFSEICSHYGQIVSHYKKYQTLALSKKKYSGSAHSEDSSEVLSDFWCLYISIFICLAKLSMFCFTLQSCPSSESPAEKTKSTDVSQELNMCAPAADQHSAHGTRLELSQNDPPSSLHL